MNSTQIENNVKSIVNNFDVDLSVRREYKILVVEDNKINQMITQKMLEKVAIDCKIIDNGIGIKDTQKRKSGLQNAETRILAIKGSLTFDSTIQKGCKITVVIPK